MSINIVNIDDTNNIDGQSNIDDKLYRKTLTLQKYIHLLLLHYMKYWVTYKEVFSNINFM